MYYTAHQLNYAMTEIDVQSRSIENLTNLRFLRQPIKSFNRITPVHQSAAASNIVTGPNTTQTYESSCQQRQLRSLSSMMFLLSSVSLSQSLWMGEAPKYILAMHQHALRKVPVLKTFIQCWQAWKYKHKSRAWKIFWRGNLSFQFPDFWLPGPGPALPIHAKTKLKHDWLISHVGWLWYFM
jgi:hypothetical protein